MTASPKNPERFNMRLDPELKQMVQYAASLKGLSVAGYLKSVLARAAAQDIEEQELLSLSLKDRLAFAEAILEPIEPSAATLESGRIYKETFGL